MRRPLKSLLPCVACALVVASFSGCRGRTWCQPPGPMNLQQANAIVHDPFPQADVGPSDPSGRPPDYQTPLPQPVRNRIVPDAMPWLGR